MAAEIMKTKPKKSAPKSDCRNSEAYKHRSLTGSRKIVLARDKEEFGAICCRLFICEIFVIACMCGNRHRDADSNTVNTERARNKSRGRRCLRGPARPFPVFYDLYDRMYLYLPPTRSDRLIGITDARYLRNPITC